MAEQHRASCYGPAGELQWELSEHAPLPDPCPAFPADPVPHRWTPVGIPMAAALDRHRIVVIEVCPSCRQYRHTAYSYVPRDADGVQSTT